ncbi:MAG: CRISPR-associated ring nuclease Csm6 [Gammaproteobacteria bacterium]
MSSHQRRILFAVTGLTPQVLTETLYVLTQLQSPPFVPTEIHLLTTAEGARRARLALLSEEPGWFQRLRRDYALPVMDFSAANIHLFRDEAGQPLDDIRTPEDNQRAADMITEMVRDFTADPASALHVSIAGGRKTMGYYAGYALSLFARSQDRLSHVLVSEPFESSWDFFYPTPYSRVITTRENKLADTAEARVSLAEIPFVSLRHGVDEALREGHATFSEAVASARRALQPPRLCLDLAAQRIAAGGVVVSLPPVQLALLSVFARRVLTGHGPLAAPNKDVPEQAWAERFLAEYRRIRSGDLDDLERTERALARGMDGGYFSSHLSKLRRRLRRALGPAARPYLIDDGGCRPPRYRLALAAEAIEYGTLQAHGKPAGHEVHVNREQTEKTDRSRQQGARS